MQLPGGLTQGVTCALAPTSPQLLAVSTPYFGAAAGTLTISGVGFGATQGTGQVTLDGTVVLPVSAWSDTSITVGVPAATARGPRQLAVRAGNGQRTVNGLTLHLLGAGYNPTVVEVGPGRAHGTIQAGLDAAWAAPGTSKLVVVYPGLPDPTNPRLNPRGAYYENLILDRPVKLQGVGPGGFQGTTFVPGSIIDGGAIGGDTAMAEAWRTRIAGLYLERQPDRVRGGGGHGVRDRRPVRRDLPGHHRRLRHPRRRPAGLPGQHQRDRRDPDRPARQRHHPGRRRVRQRLRALPPDQQQRAAEQRRRRTAARSGSARPTSPSRSPATGTSSSRSSTTGSSPTAAPTWPAAWGSSPGPTASRWPATISAGTPRPSTAAG